MPLFFCAYSPTAGGSSPALAIPCTGFIATVSGLPNKKQLSKKDSCILMRNDWRAIVRRSRITIHNKIISWVLWHLWQVCLFHDFIIFFSGCAVIHMHPAPYHPPWKSINTPQADNSSWLYVFYPWYKILYLHLSDLSSFPLHFKTPKPC